VTPGFWWSETPLHSINKTLNEGDGAAISNEKKLEISAIDPAEILPFDIA
jgi:Quercetinase C-terminal cupin domain